MTLKRVCRYPDDQTGPFSQRRELIRNKQLQERVCRYPDDLKGPQAVLIVPHRELGVQLALIIYRMFGGSVNAGVPGEKANMFTYFGPAGIKVKGCLDKEEVIWAKNRRYLNGAHVVVGTPGCLAECLAGPESLDVMQHTKVRPHRFTVFFVLPGRAGKPWCDAAHQGAPSSICCFFFCSVLRSAWQGRKASM